MANAATMTTARERGYLRGLRDARRANSVATNTRQRMNDQRAAAWRRDADAMEREVQEQAYLAQQARGIAESHVAVQQPERFTAPQQARSDAQIAQALAAERQQQQQARALSPQKQRALNAQKKIIADYNRINWTVLYTAAFLDDAMDFIPLPGMSALPSLYVTVKLRKIGPVQQRKASMGWRIILMLIDMIPIINIAPISLGIVYNAREKERKRVAAAKAYVRANGGDAQK